MLDPAFLFNCSRLFACVDHLVHCFFVLMDTESVSEQNGDSQQVSTAEVVRNFLDQLF